MYSHEDFCSAAEVVRMEAKMAAVDKNNLTYALPDLSALTEAEKLQVMAVVQRAKVS